MKILATFIILLTLCSLTLNKKSLKSNAEKGTKSTIKSENKATSENKADPGASLPAAAVNQ